MGTNKKSLAKVFGPAVLLTAALALPIEGVAFAAPAPGIAAVKVDKHKQGKQQKHQNRVNRGQARKQQVQAQREQARKQQVRVQRQQTHQKRVAAQQAQARQQRIAAQQQRQQRVARQQAQIRQQRIENQRLAAIRQQQIAAQRQAQIRRQRDLQIARERAAVRRYNNGRYVYDNRYYNNQYRGRGGADRSVIAADGYLEDNGRCFILRGHQGQVYNLVGGTEGLREGEHVRLVGRLLYDRDGCGEAMDVHQVQAIWADRNHRQTYFDHQRDGSFRNSYRQRYGDRYYDEYRDDYRYDDYYYDPR